MDDLGEEDRLAGELLALKATVRWLVAQVLAQGPDPRGAAQRLESHLLETIELARFANTEGALRVATTTVQNMMDLLDFSADGRSPQGGAIRGLGPAVASDDA